jgi:hypothetical protein
MEADLHRSLSRRRSPRRSREPSLEDRLVARLLAPWLDRELADGELDETARRTLSEAHAARAAQLTRDRNRRSVARRLDRLIARAETPRHASSLVASITAGSSPCRDQVRQATPLIASLAARLRSGEPLDACAVARLKTLLGDRSGPCYTSSRPDALTTALCEVSELLDGPQAGASREPSEQLGRRTQR